MQILVGFLLALTIAAGARVLRSLSQGGAAAAIVLGTVVYGFGGWRAALLLITFFASSSVIGRIVRHPGDRTDNRYAKGSERDAGQVLGNGIVPGLLAFAIGVNPAELWPWLGLAGAIAAVTADTWATELGALSPIAPRLITRPSRRVPAGTSGGVSPIGSVAAAAGAAVIGILAAAVLPMTGAKLIVPITLAGLAAALFDSVLGATVQAMYRCSADGIETEQHPLHRCGASTEHVRGWSWLNNDRVNLACSLAGAILATLIGALAGLL